MTLREQLTKENFFNELMDKYPKAMKVFCNWIDEYKEEVNWDCLFTDLINIKFHDLPFDMQIGIILRFLIEEKYTYYVYDFEVSVTEGIIKTFKDYLSDKDFQNI